MIPLQKPYIKRREMDGVLTTLVNDQITHGQVVKKLELEIQTYLGADGCFAFNSHFAALSAWEYFTSQDFYSLTLDPFPPGSLKFFLSQKKLKTQVYDFQSQTPLMDESSVEAAPLSGSWVYLNHHLGYIPDLSGYRKKSYEIIEDVTNSLGSYRDLQLSGSQSDVVFIRLDPTSWLNAAGGCLMVIHGKKRAQLWKELISAIPDDFFLTDMNAALALVQWHDREKIFRAKKELFSHLATRLPRSTGKLPHQEGEADLILPYLPVLVESGAREVLAYAEKKGIEVRMAFQDEDSYGDLTPFPNARNFLLRCILFPLFPSLGSKDVETLGRVLSTLP